MGIHWNAKLEKNNADSFRTCTLQISLDSLHSVQSSRSTGKLTALKLLCHSIIRHVNRSLKFLNQQRSKVLLKGKTKRCWEVEIMNTEIALFARRESPLRNRLACWTSKSKVGGSSPTGCKCLPFLRSIPNLLVRLISISLATRRRVSRAISGTCETRKIIPSQMLMDLPHQ